MPTAMRYPAENCCRWRIRTRLSSGICVRSGEQLYTWLTWLCIVGIAVTGLVLYWSKAFRDSHLFSLGTSCTRGQVFEFRFGIENDRLKPSALIFVNQHEPIVRFASVP